MPLSSRNIISLIKGLPDTFELSDILHAAARNRRGDTAGKRKKKAKPPGAEVENIHKILGFLTSQGVIERKKKQYRKAGGVIQKGKLRISPGGNGTVETAGGNRIAIRKEAVHRAHDSDHVTVEITDCRSEYLIGEVRDIIRREKKFYFARTARTLKNMTVFTLLDMPGSIEIYSERYKNEPETGDLALVELEDRFSGDLQRCRVVEAFSATEEKGDIARIIARHSLPGPQPAYPELDEIEKNLPERETGRRKDYRDLYTVTIDGEDARDFDDAISVSGKKNSTTLCVHIADVSAYVKKNGAIDLEAQNRGTSFYLGTTVIHMLPEKLSTELCSLREGMDRLTLSVEMTFDAKGNLMKHEFHRGVINVAKRLTYISSHEIIETGKPKKLKKMLDAMFALAEALKKKRLLEGRIDLNLRDEKLIFDENARISEIRFEERLKSQLIIEEFMLSANEIVSRALKERGIPTLYRIHEEMSRDSLIDLKKFLQTMNFNLSASGNIGLNIQNILEKISGKEYEQVINFVVLKSMMQAYYGIDPLGHFGLGFEDYAHFTSPIRRYPDLIVHRCLKSLIDRSHPPYSASELLPIGEKSSEMERIAQKAERNLVKLKSCRLMAHRVGEIFDVIVSGISRNGLFVTLAEKPVEGMIPLKNLTDDYYLVMEDEFTAVGRRYGKRFRIGDKIRARLAGVDIDLMRIDFDLP